MGRGAGRAVGTVLGAAKGFAIGGPVGAIVGGYAGYRAGDVASKALKSKQPPAAQTQANNQIANQLAPVNLVEIMDELSQNRLNLIRGADGKIGVRFQSNGNRVPLDAPIDTSSVNTNLPPVRRITGRNITEEAAQVIVLTQAMRQLIGTIETMERTNPMLIEQNRELLDNFKAAQQVALDRNFDIKQQGIDTKLAKMGLLNSSTALGVQVSLAREKAEAQLKVNLEGTLLGQQLKQQSLENMYQRGDQIANTANIELGRFQTETGNQLQLRAQDMQSELATQELEQQRAISQANLELSRNDQLIQAELGRRQLQAQQQNSLLGAGMNLLNSGNEQAIGARTVDNQAINNQNQYQMRRYELSSNPMRELALAGLGQFVGRTGSQLGKRFGQSVGTEGGPGSSFLQMFNMG